MKSRSPLLPLALAVGLVAACQPGPAAHSVSSSKTSAATSPTAPATAWRRIADIPTGRSEVAAAVSQQQSRVFVIGGFGGPERVELRH